MAINRKQEEREKNWYVWRWDFSLLGKDDSNSEIGREVKKQISLYKTWLLIGEICWVVLVLSLIALFVYHADLIYIRLLGITVFLTGLMYGKLLKTSKITRNDIKNLEDELNMKSDSLEEFDAIFTENALIVQQDIMIYRIPYLEIVRITIKQRTNRYGGTRVQYRLLDGTKIETVYYCSRLKSFDPLRERLLKYNPDINISIYRDGKREILEEK